MAYQNNISIENKNAKLKRLSEWWRKDSSLGFHFRYDLLQCSAGAQNIYRIYH